MVKRCPLCGGLDDLLHDCPPPPLWPLGVVALALGFLACVVLGISRR